MPMYTFIYNWLKSFKKHSYTLEPPDYFSEHIIAYLQQHQGLMHDRAIK